MNQLQFVSVQWQSERYRQAVDLRHRVLRSPLGLEFSVGDLESEQFQMHYAALNNHELVGCVILDRQPHGTAKLRQMAVKSNDQRSGIGTFLIQNVENELNQLGTRVIKLHARKTAIGFYERLGYEIQGDEFIEVTLPHSLMTKVLRA